MLLLLSFNSADIRVCASKLGFLLLLLLFFDVSEAVSGSHDANAVFATTVTLPNLGDKIEGGEESWKVVC